MNTTVKIRKRRSTPASRVLFVGYYPELLALRSHLLRQNGYDVMEAAELSAALSLADNDGNDVQLLLFCNSVPAEDQAKIMSRFLRKRRLPTLSICRLEDTQSCPGTPVSTSPEDLLAEVKAALGA